MSVIDDTHRIRCPKCNHLREGFCQSGNNLFLTPELLFITFECLNCHHKFQVEYETTGKFYGAGKNNEVERAVGVSSP